MEFTLSKHAEDVIREREISLDWVALTIAQPTTTHSDPDDPQLRHALRAMPDFDYRALRVVYNATRNPPHVVTVYFDRSMKGKL